MYKIGIQTKHLLIINHKKFILKQFFDILLILQIVIARSKATYIHCTLEIELTFGRVCSETFVCCQNFDNAHI